MSRGVIAAIDKGHGSRGTHVLGLVRRIRGWWSSTTTYVPDGPPSPAPIWVAPSEAPNFVAAYRAITLVANDFARSPMVVEGDDAFASLMESPSRYHGSFEFKRACIWQALVGGECFGIVSRDGFGDVVEIQLRDPGICSAQWDTTRLRYFDAKLGEIPPEKVFHLKAPSALGLVGDAPFARGRTALEFYAALNAFGLKCFTSGGVSKFALVHPLKPDDAAIKAMRESWKQSHRGIDNMDIPAILKEGMKPERIGSTLKDAMFDQSLDRAIGDVARLTGVPVPYLSLHHDTAYANQEWLGRIYVEGCLEHWAAAFACEAGRKLMRPGATVRIDFERIAAASFSERVSSYKSAVEGGFCSKEYAARRLGFPELPPDQRGFVKPLNMGNAGGTAGGGAPGRDTVREAGAVR